MTSFVSDDMSSISIDRSISSISSGSKCGSSRTRETSSDSLSSAQCSRPSNSYKIQRFKNSKKTSSRTSYFSNYKYHPPKHYYQRDGHNTGRHVSRREDPVNDNGRGPYDQEHSDHRKIQRHQLDRDSSLEYHSSYFDMSNNQCDQHIYRLENHDDHTRDRLKDCSRVHSQRHSGRYTRNPKYTDLPLEWWEREEDCKHAKIMHMSRLDELCGTREDLILSTTFWRTNSDIVLETNMFPWLYQPTFRFDDPSSHKDSQSIS
jgi:hypothetical protein